MPGKHGARTTLTNTPDHLDDVDLPQGPQDVDLPQETPATEGPQDPQEPQDPATATEAPDNEGNASFQEETNANLAEAIILMTQELRRRGNPVPKAKSKEPDTFEGSDLKKLNNFILLCNLYFRNSHAYDNDEHKVTFALSYL